MISNPELLFGSVVALSIGVPSAVFFIVKLLILFFKLNISTVINNMSNPYGVWCMLVSPESIWFDIDKMKFKNVMLIHFPYTLMFLFMGFILFNFQDILYLSIFIIPVVLLGIFQIIIIINIIINK